MKNFVIAAALNKEFPFKDEFPIVYTGVGKVNATFNLYSYLNNYPQTQLVINVGSAGGITERIGSVIECGTFIDGQLDYPGYIEEHIVHQASKKICLTYDNFITKTPNKIGHCVDMEAFALAKTCFLMGVNFLCFKYISDIIGENNQENKWLENHKSGKDLLKEIIKNTV
jgi:adenosylhomocysteine nucleosidase